MDYRFVEHNPERKASKEIVMRNADVVLPTDVPAGSVAYTGDMTYMAVFDGVEWKQVGGSD